MNAICPRPAVAPEIPPRPVVVHRDECVNVAFHDFGTVSVTGPRRAELANMVAALPKVLRQLGSVLAMLEERDGATAPHVIGLAEALEDAGINPHGTLEVEPMTHVTPADPAERFALMLRATADTLDDLLSDPKRLHTTPNPIRETLRDLSASIRAVLRENGRGASCVEERSTVSVSIDT
ncbi:hypothetical protein [Azospirillum sp.]|uniref:hypothetical protein n=1 Tax=Azospirillum sp. TaxID=34012 RepID=UPI003D75D87E